MIKLSQAGAIHIFILLIIIIGIGVGIYLVQSPQIFNPKASQNQPQTGFYFELEKKNFRIGEMISPAILVRSDISAANLFAANIKFDPTVLQLISVSVTNAPLDESTPSSIPSATPIILPSSTPTPSPTPIPTPTPAPSPKPAGVTFYIDAAVNCSDKEGLTPDQLCQKAGYSRAKASSGNIVAKGWWWKQCGGPSLSNCSGLECTINDVDCTGGGGHEYLWNQKKFLVGDYVQTGDNKKLFRPEEFESCSRMSPGWKLRIACQYDAGVLGAQAGIITTWTQKFSNDQDLEKANNTGLINLIGAVIIPQHKLTTPNTQAGKDPAMYAILNFRAKSNSSPEGTKIQFTDDSAIYRNSDNVNMLRLPDHNPKRQELVLSITGGTQLTATASATLTPSAQPANTLPTTSTTNGVICAQVITIACKQTNQDACKKFPNACIPNGWIKQPSDRIIKGDADKDQDVSNKDLSILITNFGKPATNNQSLDFNNDNFINTFDYLKMKKVINDLSN